jgi:hypothetical protein
MTNSDGGMPPGNGQQTGGYHQPSGYPLPGGEPRSSGYAQPSAPQQAPAPYGAPYPPLRPTNTLAIITLVAAFVVPVVGIVTGHIALGQLKTSGEQGEGLAKAGLIISYVYCAIVIGLLLISIIAPMLIFAAFIPFWESVPTSP